MWRTPSSLARREHLGHTQPLGGAHMSGDAAVPGGADGGGQLQVRPLPQERPGVQRTQ